MTFRVTETRDPQKPSAIIYQGENTNTAKEAFNQAMHVAEVSSLILMEWINKGKGHVWKTRMLFKRYT